MRIAMVSEHASPLAHLGGTDAGGQNVYVADLADELVRQGHEVVVHTRRDRPDLARRVPTSGGAIVDHVDAGPPAPIAKDHLLPYMDAFADDLAAQWRSDPPHVVHAHFWMSGLASVRAAAVVGVPVVQTFHALGAVKRRHQGNDDTSPARRTVIERALVDRVGRVIATCEDERRELLDLGAPPDRIRIVPCGVDLDLFSPVGPRWARAANRRRLLVVGRLVERKGITDVVRAVADLDGVELLIAGGPDLAGLRDDADADRIRRAVRRCQVEDRVTLLGGIGRRDLPALIRSADVVVSVPYYEPFGMVALEAMACGTPPVVSCVGGLAESVVDGRTGLHVAAGDPSGLARAVRRLMADDDLRLRLGRLGVERVRQGYGWPVVAAATVAVYNGLPVAPGPRVTL